MTTNADYLEEEMCIEDDENFVRIGENKYQKDIYAKKSDIDEVCECNLSQSSGSITLDFDLDVYIEKYKFIGRIAFHYSTNHDEDEIDYSFLSCDKDYRKDFRNLEIDIESLRLVEIAKPCISNNVVYTIDGEFRYSEKLTYYEFGYVCGSSEKVYEDEYGNEIDCDSVEIIESDCNPEEFFLLDDRFDVRRGFKFSYKDSEFFYDSTVDKFLELDKDYCVQVNDFEFDIDYLEMIYENIKEITFREAVSLLRFLNYLDFTPEQIEALLTSEDLPIDDYFKPGLPFLKNEFNKQEIKAFVSAIEQIRDPIISVVSSTDSDDSDNLLWVLSVFGDVSEYTDIHRTAKETT